MPLLPRSRLALLGVLLAFALAGSNPGRAEVTPKFDSAVAINATTVLAVSRDGCSSSQALSWVSRDRGRSWNRGSCIPNVSSGSLVLYPDSTLDRAFYWRGQQQQAVTLDASGAVISTAPVGYDVPVASVAGVMYAVNAASGGVRIDSNGAHPCGAVRAGGQVSAASASVVLAVGGDYQTDGWVSYDGCSSFIALPPTPEKPCAIQLVADSELVCSAINSSHSYLLQADAWQPSPLLDSARCQGALTRQGRRLVCLDSYATAALTHTWPKATPATHGGPVPRKYRRALSFANARYRRPLGLPDLQWSSTIARAAAAHIRYVTLNPPRSAGLIWHYEQRGKRGFTGYDPNARCRVAGYPGGCAEDMSSFSDPYAAVQQLVLAPFHTAPFLQSSVIGMASGTRGFTTVDFDYGENGFVDLDTPPNRPDSWLHVWPAAGMRGVTTAWRGGEYPDPLQNYRGNRRNVGPALFVNAAVPVRVSLTGPSGVVPLLQVSAKNTETTLTGSSLAMFAAHQLAPHTTYTLHVQQAAGDSPPSQFPFTTS